MLLCVCSRTVPRALLQRCDRSLQSNRQWQSSPQQTPVTRSPDPFLYSVCTSHIFVHLGLMVIVVQRTSDSNSLLIQCILSYHFFIFSQSPGFFIDLRSVSLAYSPSLWAWCARGPLPRRKCYRAIVHGRVDIVPHCLLTFCHQSYQIKLARIVDISWYADY